MSKAILSLILCVYALAILMGTIFIFWAIKEFKRFKKRNVHLDQKNLGETFGLYILKEKLHFEIVDVKKYEKLKNPILDFFTTIALLFCVLSDLPMFIFQMFLAIINMRFLWRMAPVSLYMIWRIIFLLLGYSLIVDGHPGFGLMVGILTILSALQETASYFEKDDQGIMKLFKTPKHKMQLAGIIEGWIFITLGFANAYFALNALAPSSFSANLTVLDSIYFSFVTIATVGYGDIAPVAWSGKIFVIAEIIVGFLYLAIMLTLFLSVWIKKYAPQESDAPKTYPH